MNRYDSRLSLRIAELLSRKLQSDLFQHEQEELQQWIDQSDANRLLFDEICDQKKQKRAFKKMQSYRKYQVLEKILDENVLVPKRFSHQLFRKWYYAAACVLLFLAISWIWFSKFSGHSGGVNDMLMSVSSLDTGEHTVLTLSDGTTLTLDENKEGIVVGDKLSYRDGTVLDNVVSTPESLLSLTTPIGKQYRITLPDGTQVWLNAASSLKYPAHFGADERRVELTGEAYFEVASCVDKNQKRIPFFVESKGQRVEVLGTHFNINAYTDNQAIRTTLIEGSVRVEPLLLGKSQNRGVVIKPGEQALLTSNDLEVGLADTEQVLGWKNGDFIFKQESLYDIMHSIERWYGMEVIYTGNVNQQRTYSGKFSMQKDVIDILSALESTEDVRFTVDGKRIVVMNKNKVHTF